MLHKYVDSLNVTNIEAFNKKDYFIKTMKIAKMNNVCNKVIINGFDVVLSNRDSYHFSLTTQDRLNLITLFSMITTGDAQITLDSLVHIVKSSYQPLRFC